MQKLIIASAILLCSICGAATTAEPSAEKLVGVWIGEFKDGRTKARMEIEFRRDGSHATKAYFGEEGGFVPLTGAYTLTGKTLKITQKGLGGREETHNYTVDLVDADTLKLGHESLAGAFEMKRQVKKDR